MQLLYDFPRAAFLHSPRRTTPQSAVACRAPRAQLTAPDPRRRHKGPCWLCVQAADVRPAVATSAWSLLLPEAAQAISLPRFSTGELALMDGGGSIWWPLLLSTLAGLSTAIGGLIAVSFEPSESALAFLLGTAIGVMATVSGVELWWHSAAEQNDFAGISAAVAAGAILFAVLDRLLPDHSQPEHDKTATAVNFTADVDHQSTALLVRVDARQHQHHASSSNNSSSNDDSGHDSNQAVIELDPDHAPLLPRAHSGSTSRPSNSSRSRHSKAEHVQCLHNTALAKQQSLPMHSRHCSSAHSSSCGSELGTSIHQVGGHHTIEQQPMQQQQQPRLYVTVAATAADHDRGDEQQRLLQAHHAGMLRLGLLMTITLTLHNLPEGFAVAFSAYTSIGPIMALAIALHNIPEGLVIAAPLYAATGSKLKALGMTAASGLSEPIGALLALLVFKPFVTSVAQLDYVLAITGGVMLAVCVLELWPEGVRCGQTVRLIQGIALGTIIMGWTLYVGV